MPSNLQPGSHGAETRSTCRYCVSTLYLAYSHFHLPATPWLLLPPFYKNRLCSSASWRINFILFFILFYFIFLNTYLFSCIRSQLRHAGSFTVALGPSSCDPWALERVDYTVHGILQARMLEYYTVHRILQARILQQLRSSSLLQGIFPTQR